jgi:FtsH-binding integral membrane protein
MDGQDRMNEMLKTSPLFSKGWIAVSVVAILGIIAIWLIYQIPGVCAADAGGDCGGDLRLLPAVIGTIVLIGLWVIAVLLRRRSRPEHDGIGWTPLFAILIVIAAILAPIITLYSDGFVFPWW